MINPIVDVKDWCERYKIKNGTSTCVNCHYEHEMNVPIAIPGYRGVMMEDHGCPIEFRRITFVPISKEKIEFWKSVL